MQINISKKKEIKEERERGRKRNETLALTREENKEIARIVIKKFILS